MSISCVLAGDIDETVDHDEFEVETNESEDIVLASNFTELNTLINESDGDVNLTDDYESFDGDDDVVISKSVYINGNGHSVNSANSPIFIDANYSSIVFERINFINPQFNISNYTNSVSLIFVDCNFTHVNNDSTDPIIIYPPEMHTTGEISSTVRTLAKSIVGVLKGYDAAYKLAKWVGRNIVHESAGGFYQTPDVTLERRRGNCCSQTDLFLQMCAAVGVTENHKMYYVHVGSYKLGERHFFAMIDNILIDVDARPSSPWGKASTASRSIMRLTEYPYLPLMRDY